MDIERLNFMPQYPCINLQGSFASREQAHKWHTSHTSRPTNVDNLPITLLSHKWKNRLNQTDNTKKVGIELLTRLINGSFFDCSNEEITRIVDENIAPPSSCGDSLDTVPHRLLRAY